LFLDKFRGSALTEFISPRSAFNRVSACAVFAEKCDPVYNASAMDGIAVNCEITLTATETDPLTLEENKDFIFVNTGAPLSGKYNSVIMIEDVIDLGEGLVKITAAAYPWQNVRVVGESLVSGEMVIPSNHLITAADIGALIASGCKAISLFIKNLRLE
jgi:putative molybdopterin biosynthesis protein